MVARRLLIVMLVLLGLSTLAAALIPTNRLRNDDTASTITDRTQPTTTTAAEPPPLEGRSLKTAITVGDGPVKVVPIEVGDQLHLVISSARSDQLEIPALGLLEAVGPNLPARFDILAREPIDYGIRYVQANRVVARVEVAKRKPKPKKAGDAPKGPGAS